MHTISLPDGSRSYYSHMKKDYFWNTLGTSATNFISLLLMIVVTRINGIEATGVFTFCFAFACIFFMIGFYGGRIYQVSDVTGEFESKNYIFLKFLTSIAMMISAIIFVIINKYDTERAVLLIFLSLYKMTDALADPLYGVVQRKGKLYWAGFSMLIKAIVGFVAFVIVDLLTQNILLASLCLLAANVLFIFAWDIPRMLKIEHISGLFRGNLSPSLSLIKSSAYVCVISVLIGLLPNIIRYFVDIHYDEATLGSYGIIIMPATMLYLFVGFVLQPKLINLSKTYSVGQYKAFDRSVNKIIFISLAFGVFAILLAWFIGCPVLTFILTEDIYPYRLALTLIVIGGTINTLTIICNNVLSIMRKFTLQIIGCIAGTISAFIASAILIEPYGLDGSAMAFIIAATTQSIVFIVGYKITLKKQL